MIRHRCDSSLHPAKRLRSGKTYAPVPRLPAHNAVLQCGDTIAHINRFLSVSEMLANSAVNKQWQLTLSPYNQTRVYTHDFTSILSDFERQFIIKVSDSIFTDTRIPLFNEERISPHPKTLVQLEKLIICPRGDFDVATRQFDVVSSLSSVHTLQWDYIYDFADVRASGPLILFARLLQTAKQLNHIRLLFPILNERAPILHCFVLSLAFFRFGACSNLNSISLHGCQSWKAIQYLSYLPTLTVLLLDGLDGDLYDEEDWKTLPLLTKVKILHINCTETDNLIYGQFIPLMPSLTRLIIHPKMVSWATAHRMNQIISATKLTWLSMKNFKMNDPGPIFNHSTMATMRVMDFGVRFFVTAQPIIDALIAKKLPQVSVISLSLYNGGDEIRIDQNMFTALFVNLVQMTSITINTNCSIGMLALDQLMRCKQLKKLCLRFRSCKVPDHSVNDLSVARIGQSCADLELFHLDTDLTSPTGLIYPMISGNQFSGVNFPNLTSLSVSACLIRSFESIATLPKLTKLITRQTVGICKLRTSKSLKKLITPTLNASQLATLKTALPFTKFQ